MITIIKMAAYGWTDFYVEDDFDNLDFDDDSPAPDPPEIETGTIPCGDLDVNDPELLGSVSSDVRNDADGKLNNSLSFNMTVCVRTANCNNWCTFPGLAVQI